MNDFFRTHRHRTAGFTIAVPTGWEATEDVPDCALIMADPAPDPRRFAPNAVVTVEQLHGDESLDSWVTRSREALGDGRLNRLRTIDGQDTTVSGLPAWRTLSHYLHQVHGGVNLDQWQVARAGWGYVVSCSVGALDYDEFADTMAYVAEGLRLDEAGA